MYIVPSQENWKKSMLPTARFIQRLDEEAIETLVIIEKAGVHLNPGLLRGCVEGMVVPEDLEHWASAVRGCQGKMSAPNLKKFSSEIVRARWWQWVLYHPELQNEGLVHPSRGVRSSIAMN